MKTTHDNMNPYSSPEIKAAEAAFTISEIASSNMNPHYAHEQWRKKNGFDCRELRLSKSRLSPPGIVSDIYELVDASGIAIEENGLKEGFKTHHDAVVGPSLVINEKMMEVNADWTNLSRADKIEAVKARFSNIEVTKP